MLLLLFDGVLLLRLAQRVLLALLFQLPPRITRLEPFMDKHPLFLRKLQNSNYKLQINNKFQFSNHKHFFLKFNVSANFTNSSNGCICFCKVNSFQIPYLNLYSYCLSFFINLCLLWRRSLIVPGKTR